MRVDAVKNLSFDDWLKEELEDPEFREEWEASETGYQVACLRMERGLTQEELAKLAGTHRRCIARLEMGDYDPRGSFLRRVVGVMGGRVEVRIVANGCDEIE